MNNDNKKLTKTQTNLLDVDLNPFESTILKSILIQIEAEISLIAPRRINEQSLVDIINSHQIECLRDHRSKNQNIFPSSLVLRILKFVEPLWPIEAFRYNVENIFECYPTFMEEPATELQLLVAFANWMHILFKIISPKKSKGLSLQIVTQLVEGPDQHYCTGSGQKDATVNRVLIFEFESGTKPNKRIRRKSAAKEKVSSKSKKCNVFTEKNAEDENNPPKALKCLHETIENYGATNSPTLSYSPFMLSTTFEINDFQNVCVNHDQDEFQQVLANLSDDSFLAEVEELSKVVKPIEDISEELVEALFEENNVV